MAESNHFFAFPFHTKIQMQEAETHQPEEVPLQEIVFKNIQNFTREDFDQAKKHIESSKDGEVKGFKYTYCPTYTQEKIKYEQAKQQTTQTDQTISQKRGEEKEALPAPALLPVDLNEFTDKLKHDSSTDEERIATYPLEQKSEAVQRPQPRHLTPISLRRLPVNEEDVEDEDASCLIRCYSIKS